MCWVQPGYQERLNAHKAMSVGLLRQTQGKVKCCNLGMPTNDPPVSNVLGLSFWSSFRVGVGLPALHASTAPNVVNGKESGWMGCV